MTALAQLVECSDRLSATPARNAKLDLLAGALRSADADELSAVVAFLSGELLQRQIGVGWARLRILPAPAVTAALTVVMVADAFAAMATLAGPGSGAARDRAVEQLFGQATGDEQRFLARLVGGELRHGAQAGLMVDAVARAFDVPIAAVRRAHMLSGDLGLVARTARIEGAAGLGRIGLQVGRPVHPMLAQSDAELDEALARVGDASVEWKLDGVRVQIHRDGQDVAVFTRTLDDITARVPGLVAVARSLPVDRLVLDAEAIVLGKNGRPERFQVTASRVGSGGAGDDVGNGGLTTFVFDVLHADGEDLIDRIAAERAAVLAGVVPPALLVPRLVSPTPEQARAFLEETVARGHEGVMVKALGSRYEAGRRGAGWVKVKPVHVLDLVVLAAEWGHGRRKGWLSNLHLGARDAVSGQFVMLGKTFKGLTDEMLRWQTDRLLELQVDADEWIVHVRPELVVEVAFDGVQTSRRYPAGMALRFARVRRHRPDKPAAQADTLDAVRAIYEPTS